MVATKPVKSLTPRSPDTKYTGGEPTWEIQPTDDRFARLSRAFSWYNYYFAKKDAKEMIITWLETNGRKAEARTIKGLPDSSIRLTTGWLCRMITVGLQLTDAEHSKLEEHLAEMMVMRQADITAPEDVGVAKPNIQDRLREKMSECAGEIDGLYDELIQTGAKMTADFKPITIIRGKNVAPQMVNDIAEKWHHVKAELELAMSGKDDQLAEAYAHFGKIQLRNLIKFSEQVIADCGSYIQIKKVERKPRKTKPLSAEKVTAKFKYLKEFAELKLKSEPVTKLAEAQEAWLYDTKKRKLIHVVADSHAGSFRVKGSTIIGYDTVQSTQKTLRKPAEQLKALMALGAPGARKYYKDIKSTDVAFNGRGNDNLVILKVR
jgi:hypothetical protein